MEYYKILSKDVPVECITTATNDLIQLSNMPLRDFKPVIEDEILPEKEGYNVVSNYVIIENEVHKTYHYEEAIVDEQFICGEEN